MSNNEFTIPEIKGNIVFLDLCLENSIHLIVDGTSAIFYKKYQGDGKGLPSDHPYIFRGPDRFKNAIEAYNKYNS